jgi:hypothetical protein
MIIHTACATCKLEHTVTDEHPNVHPGCQPPPATAEDKLLGQFIQAVLERRNGEADKLEKQANAVIGQPPPLARAAEYYASEYGWPVFPLKPHSKTPATANGFKDATLDLDRIRAYWKQHPQANIGIPTGIHFDVIDIDVPDGIPSYQKLLDNTDLTIYGRACTSSSGLHLLVKPTGAGNTVRIDPGVDYRGVGGYIVAPPSWLGKPGTAWAWLNTPSPSIREAPPQ